MTRDTRTSPWLYVGLGCVAAVVLLVGLLIAGGWFAKNQLERMAAEMKDPSARAAKVEKILGTRELPDGYYPAFAMSVPFVFEIAVLSDVPGEGSESGPDRMRFEERGFIYTETLGGGSQTRELERYFADKGPPPTTVGSLPWHAEGDLVAHGELPVAHGRLLYRTLRGRFHFGRQGKRGLVTLLLVRCSADQRSRFGTWFGPDPSPTMPAAELDLRGTTGDPEAIGRFVGHFDLCPSAG